MLRQIKYFQSVVKNNSFSEAAEECHISQSAISQQIQALERELGVSLFIRKNRRFELTPAGEFFYQKSLILLDDYNRICAQARKIADQDVAVLRIGLLRGYAGMEFPMAAGQFGAKYPEVETRMRYGNHEELYQMLRTGEADLVFNDQRRAFSDEYRNLTLTTENCYIEISSRSILAGLERISPQELKNIPCILITSKGQQEIEREYYHDVVGFSGNFIFAENLEEAKLMVISGKGFLLTDGECVRKDFEASIARIPLYRGDSQITRKFCAFWKKDNSGYYIEEFAEMLKEQYSHINTPGNSH